MTHTTTVAPSSTGQAFSGNGSTTLAPMTIPPNGVVVQWTAQPDQFGDNSFVVSSSPDDVNSVEFDNGSGATSGSSFIPAGTYTFEVTASAGVACPPVQASFVPAGQAAGVSRSTSSCSGASTM